MIKSSNEFILTIIAATIILLVLLGMILILVLIYYKKQQKHIQEKATLQAQYEQEIVNSQNEIQEQTMKHISRELHDNVAQMLTLMKIQLNNLAEDNPTITKIADSKAIVNQALGEVRNLSKSLNSDNLLSAGICKAIAFEIERIQKATDIKISFDQGNPTIAIESKKEILVFRIFQELMQNILKHAQAKNIAICLYLNVQTLSLEVTDDGVGFDINDKMQKNGFGDGSGLKNLFHRAHLMNGKLTFDTRPTGGTIARLTIPT